MSNLFLQLLQERPYLLADGAMGTGLFERGLQELARRVAEDAGRPVAVGGSIGPTGELLQPLGLLSFEDAVASFAEQALGLRDGGGHWRGARRAAGGDDDDLRHRRADHDGDHAGGV